MLDDSPDTVVSTVSGSVYVAAVWVRAPAGRSVTLRLRERNGSTTVRSATRVASGTGAWQRLEITGFRAAGGTRVGVEVVVSLARGTRAQIDDVSLQRAS